MTPEAEQRIRTAAAELADALISAVQADGSDTPDRLLSVTEAAERLGLGRSKVYGEIAAQRLHSLTIGDRRLVPAAAIREYIAQAATK